MNEAESRIIIDEQLRQVGWRLPGDNAPNVRAGQRIGGEQNLEADYVLQDENQFPLAVLEAKREDTCPLSAKEQARQYAEQLNAPYIILSNGKQHYFWEVARHEPIPIRQLPSPQTLKRRRGDASERKPFAAPLIDKEYILKAQGKNCPPEKQRQLRDYQVAAVQAVQQAAEAGKKSFLLEMATGTGKTLVSAAAIQLFMSTGNARRVLFIVDRLELETQAQKNFIIYFGESWQSVIYKQHRDDWNRAEVVITTIQSLTTNEHYRRFSPLDFDLLIVDEAHRAIGGGGGRKVFDYFCAYKLGLTATPKDYLRGANFTGAGTREQEARQLRDTYHTFGCEQGEPTYRYDLQTGADAGHLIMPRIIDARTEKTTELLSKDGWSFVVEDKDGGDLQIRNFKRKDYEKTLFSQATDKAMCRAFLTHAMRDPISGDIGKTIVYCVSQDHAAKIAAIFNQIAADIFPGKYESDFALQVTSRVEHAQDFAEQFSENTLRGKTRTLDDYGSCKTRICVTVGMMTTGYDCPDILNICFMRPIFSPTEFIQMRGRGTRPHTFKYDGGKQKSVKNKFILFDFFAVCEYFQKDHIYDAKLKLPLAATSNDDIPPAEKRTGAAIYEGADAPASICELDFVWGMRIDHDKDKKILAKLLANKELRHAVESGKLAEAAELCRLHYQNELDILELRACNHQQMLDRKVGIGEVLQLLFDVDIKLKDRETLLNETTEEFCAELLEGDKEKDAAAEIFKACLDDSEILEIVQSGEFARLMDKPQLSLEACQKISSTTRKKIIKHIQTKANKDIFEIAA